MVASYTSEEGLGFPLLRPGVQDVVNAISEATRGSRSRNRSYIGLGGSTGGGARESATGRYVGWLKIAIPAPLHAAASLLQTLAELRAGGGRALRPPGSLDSDESRTDGSLALGASSRTKRDRVSAGGREYGVAKLRNSSLLHPAGEPAPS